MLPFFKTEAAKGRIYIIGSKQFMKKYKWNIRGLSAHMAQICSNTINMKYAHNVLRNAIENNQVILAVTQERNLPIGFLIFKKNVKCLKSPPNIRMLEISLICTDTVLARDQNRKAIGSTLLGWFIYEAKQSKMFDMIILEVANPGVASGSKYGTSKLHNTHAYNFYKKFGFIETPSIFTKWKCFNQLYAYPSMKLDLNKLKLNELKKQIEKH